MEATNQGEVPKLSQVIQIDGGRFRSTWEKSYAVRWKRR
jgi:hypothetical protein